MKTKLTWHWHYTMMDDMKSGHLTRLFTKHKEDLEDEMVTRQVLNVSIQILTLNAFNTQNWILTVSKNSVNLEK